METNSTGDIRIYLHSRASNLSESHAGDVSKEASTHALVISGSDSFIFFHM